MLFTLVAYRSNGHFYDDGWNSDHHFHLNLTREELINKLVQLRMEPYRAGFCNDPDICDGYDYVVTTTFKGYNVVVITKEMFSESGYLHNVPEEIQDEFDSGEEGEQLEKDANALEKEIEAIIQTRFEEKKLKQEEEKEAAIARDKENKRLRDLQELARLKAQYEK